MACIGPHAGFLPRTDMDIAIYMFYFFFFFYIYIYPLYTNADTLVVEVTA